MDTCFQSHVKGGLCCNLDIWILPMLLAGNRINTEQNGTLLPQEAQQQPPRMHTLWL